MEYLMTAAEHYASVLVRESPGWDKASGQVFGLSRSGDQVRQLSRLFRQNPGRVQLPLPRHAAAAGRLFDEHTQQIGTWMLYVIKQSRVGWRNHEASLTETYKESYHLSIDTSLLDHLADLIPFHKEYHSLRREYGLIGEIAALALPRTTTIADLACLEELVQCLHQAVLREQQEASRNKYIRDAWGDYERVLWGIARMLQGYAPHRSRFQM